MKISLISIRRITSLLVTAFLVFPCWNIQAEEASYFGARFKEGQGIELSDETKNILKLQTAEVEERQRGSHVVAIIPSSSLLKTVTGTYVYVVNGSYYLRTEVRANFISNEEAEISDGLFAGDEIVLKPVNSLWYAELQALRGGKACTDGH